MRHSFRISLLFLACVGGLTVGAARAETPNYVSFFHPLNGMLEAYLDLNNQTTDTNGYRVVNVKLGALSDAFRRSLKRYFASAEQTAYGIDTYAIDCTSKQIGERHLAYYDSSDLPLTQNSYGTAIGTPVTGSMAYYLMQKVCGF